MIATAWKSIPLFASVIFLLVIVLAGILAPVIAPNSPTRVELLESNVPPAWLPGGSAEHLLGTDHFGRDVFSRLVYGARVTLLLSLVPVLAAALVGTSVGLIAGYFGGRISFLDFRLTDLPLVLFAILPVLLAQFAYWPTLLLSPGLIGRPGLQMLIIINAVLPAVVFAHQVWRETLSIKEEDTLRQVREAGVGHFPIIIQQIFPRVANSLIVLLPLLMVYLMVYFIVLGPSLSFRGLAFPPGYPAWGMMMAEGRENITSAWWVFAFPALAILLTAFSLSLLANQLRDQCIAPLSRGVMVVRAGGLLAALLVALLSLGMVTGPRFPPGYIYPLAWLVGAAIVWQGYQRYKLPGSKAIFLGFALVLASPLVAAVIYLPGFVANMLGVGDLAGFFYGREGFGLLAPVAALPGFADTPYERLYAVYLVPVISLPVLAGILLLAYGLWAMRKEAARRPTGGG